MSIDSSFLNIFSSLSLHLLQIIEKMLFEDVCYFTIFKFSIFATNEPIFLILAFLVIEKFFVIFCYSFNIC